MTEINGIVETIRYCGEDGFHIIELDCNNEMVVAVGIFPPITEGENVTLTGDFVVHQKFGKQFKVERIQKNKPSSAAGLARYLGSGLFKGVGPKTAVNIVEAFGLKALEIIETRPHLLSKIKGVSKQKAELIAAEFKKNKVIQNAVIFLQDKGISLKMSLKIYKFYGEETIATVSQNPYKLIEDIDGIGFLTADRIAQNAGIGKDSPFRARAAIIHVLKEASEKEGHTFLYKNEVAEMVEKLIGRFENLFDVLNELLVLQKIKSVALQGGEAIFLRSVYWAENGAGSKLVNLIKNARVLKQDYASDIEKDINAYQRIHSIEFNEEQIQALTLAINSGVCVITGGPGTGKTTIIKCLINLFEARGLDIMLMAPTGRAAKRMNESTGHLASTIHRAVMAVGAGEANGDFARQLDCDVVIVDEVSMVDVFLLNMLLKTLREGTLLIFLGDNDQLPSVGAGNVISDLINNLPSIRLRQIYRQSQQSRIITNAHLINSGQMPILFEKTGDFFFIKEKTAANMARLVCDLVSYRLPSYLNIQSDKIQTLCAMKNGEAGTINLNQLLANTINPQTEKHIKVGSNIFKEGDRVMQTTNNYNQEWIKDAEKGEGVFNGDIGIIISISISPLQAEILFEDGRKAIYTDNLDELILAYAITVHKSQGSEYDAVVIPLVGGSPMIMTRNLLYTAVTRAKKMVILIGDEYTIKRMIENNYIAKRNSALGHFIIEAESDYHKLFGIKNS